MAKVMREVDVCDVCGREENVTTVAMALDGEQQTADLCATHRQQLQEAVAGVLGAATRETIGETVRRPRRRGRKTAAGRTATAKRTPRGSATTGSPKRSPMPRTTCPHCGVEMGVQNLSRHIAAKHPEAA
jgi:hypothetical protein